MNAIPYESGEDLPYSEDVDEELPRRPRRQFFNKWSALLFAVILGGIGFYVGIRVEKGQLASSPTSAASAFASRFAGAAGATGAGGASRTGGASGAASRFGGAAGGGAGGFAALFGGGGGGSAIGTVASINGNTLYVTETSGNTVKVTLSRATKVTKNETVSKSKVFPGDSVVIAGVKGSNGTVSATTLTDSGTRSTGSTTGSGSSTTGSGGSAVSSLFGGG